MSTQLLHDFIKDACRNGKTHAEIRAVLAEAGWAEEQVNEGLKAYFDKPFPAAIPMPQPYVSPRFFVLNLFFFVVLYFTIYAGVSIAFTMLDYHLPDGTGIMRGRYYSNAPLADSLRSYIAIALVCAPLAYIGNRLIQRITRQGRRAIPTIRVRLIYMTLFIAALIMLGNFIFTVYYFLSGELGMRFLIKVALLAAVSYGIYGFYAPEIRRNEEKG